MRSKNEHSELQRENYRELRLLEEVEHAPNVSQRRLASHLGIALGVTNVLLKSLARKGYIRIVRVKWKQWVYVLTPSGISRKVYLTLAYIDNFLDHYRRIRQLLRNDLKDLALSKEASIAIYGRTELTELAFLVLRDLGLKNISVLDSELDGEEEFLGMPVRSLDSIMPGEFSKIFVAKSSDLGKSIDELESAGIPTSDVVTLLHGSVDKLTSGNVVGRLE